MIRKTKQIGGVIMSIFVPLAISDIIVFRDMSSGKLATGFGVGLVFFQVTVILLLVVLYRKIRHSSAVK
jgi:hypothetical protein